MMSDDQETRDTKRYQATLKNLYHLAKGACYEIQQLNPDLVVVLAHGGWAALWAVEALWEETTSLPFPRALVTNLGREKLRRYEDLRHTVPCVMIFPYVADHAGNHENGYFLAWLSRQSDWQEALRRQTLDALDGNPPERILVLDDTIWEGGTFRLVLGLLADTFPGCESRMLAGCFLDWRAYLIAPWLLEHNIQEDGEDGKKNRELQSLQYHLAPGTEDVDKNSLDWRPVTVESQMVQDFIQVLPAETWLELPRWVKRSIQEGVRTLHHLGAPEENEEWPLFATPTLNPIEILMKALWLRGRITRRETADLLSITPRAAGNLLADLMARDNLLPQGQGRGVHYVLPPSATTPKDQRKQPPLLDVFWVETGCLMVGETIDIWNKKRKRQQIDWLISQGIRYFIQIEDTRGFVLDAGYKKVLRQRSRKVGVSTSYQLQTFDSSQMSMKEQAQVVQTILATIRQAVENKTPVYLHGIWTRIPEAIAGCYLVEKGMTGKQALEELVRLRQGTYEPWRLAPSSEKLRRLVRRWGKRAPDSA